MITLGPRVGAGRATLFIETPDKTETTYHATDTLHDYFENFDPDVYYAKSFDPPLMPEVGRIEITTPEGESVLVQESGQWWIETEDGKERALETGLPGYPGVKNYFELFKAAELIEKQTNYPTNGLAAFGLKKPLISARLVPLGEDPNEPSNGYEVHIGTPADPQDQTRYISNGFAGKATHPVFTADSKIALAFAQTATNFRDPRLITTPSTLIESIGLKFAGGVFQVIELKADGPPILRLADSDDRALSIERLAAALKQLADARAVDYVPTQLDQWDALLSVLITPRLGAEPEPFTVYADPQANADEPTVLVHRGKEPVALRVPKSTLAGLLDPSTLVLQPR